MAHGWEWNGVGQLLFSFSGLWAQAAPRQLAHERDELAHEMECLFFSSFMDGMKVIEWNPINEWRDEIEEQMGMESNETKLF